MADTLIDVSQKHDYYLQIMQKAKQFNDQTLIKLINKRIVDLSLAGAASTSGGCVILPFPTIDNTTEFTDDEQLTWWLLIKLTLAIPGSLAALFLLTYYGM